MQKFNNWKKYNVGLDYFYWIIQSANEGIFKVIISYSKKKHARKQQKWNEPNSDD